MTRQIKLPKGKKEELTELNWELSLIMEAHRRMPFPVKFYNDAAVCPWCGCYHEQITWGKENTCTECGGGFMTGFAEWTDQNDFMPWTWVEFNEWAFRKLGMKIDLVPKWIPNERLRKIYQDFEQFYDERNGKLVPLAKSTVRAQ